MKSGIREAREIEGKPVIVKRVNSAFIGTDPEKQLRAADIKTLIICGATTDHCVETTARMAGNLGFAPPRASVFCFAAESGRDCEVYESTL